MPTMSRQLSPDRGSCASFGGDAFSDDVPPCDHSHGEAQVLAVRHDAHGHLTAVVRLGSVKQAAAQLEVSEAAVSLHIGQLRRELGDQLFGRTAAGLAFTPGGLRLASRPPAGISGVLALLPP